MFSKHVKDKINSVVLDLGGGTGTSSLFIRNQLQFQGEIDILDANIEMLYKASQKKIGFRNIIRHFVGKSGELPVRDESYDVIISTGAFVPNHIRGVSHSRNDQSITSWRINNLHSETRRIGRLRGRIRSKHRETLFGE
uniref:Methyltransferase domain-containing protein n=1 Tax=Ciona savignyi TaxID=51511 RepID=H2YX16_CIOSA